MTKTPEEMAEEYSKFNSETDIGTDLGSYRQGLFEGFLAGYQAAKDELREAVKVLEKHRVAAEKAVTNIKNASGWVTIERLEGNSLDSITNLPTSAKWISVKERLPEENEEVLVFGNILNAPKLLGVRYRVLGDQDWKYLWQGDGYIFKQEYVTHWMPLPEPPKEEK